MKRNLLLITMISSFIFSSSKLMANSAQNFTPVSFQSPEKQTQLLELYTSEGCSSCPPAEQWLSGLKNKPELWEKFVPVAFHVDYWDYLGWKDELSKSEYSKRQRSYGNQWHKPTIYTPGFVLNGEEWVHTSKIPGTVNKYPGILKAVLSDTGKLVIIYSPQNKTGNLEANIAVLGSEIIRNIKAGENGGRKLTHDFAVLNYQKFNLKKSGDYFNAETKISIPVTTAKDYSLAIWVNSENNLTPLQALGGYLSVTMKNDYSSD